MHARGVYFGGRDRAQFVREIVYCWSWANRLPLFVGESFTAEHAEERGTQRKPNPRVSGRRNVEEKERGSSPYRVGDFERIEPHEDTR